MKCPRCDFPVGRGSSCPRCGSVLPTHVSVARPGAPAPLGLTLVLALAIGAVGATLFFLQGRPAETDTPPLTSPPATAAMRSAPPSTAPAPEPWVPAAVPERAARPPKGYLLAEDAQAAQALAARVGNQLPLQPGDLATAEDLHARYPDEAALADLLQSVLLATARADFDAKHVDQALARLEQATKVGSDRRAPLLARTQIHIANGSWVEAEAVAREAIAANERDAEALWYLGLALFRQDRNREAAFALEDALAIQENPAARDILERLRKSQADEHGMQERRIAHFNVRWDGDAHESVGREILRTLERHYATLVRTLDHQPEVPIPVILFSREAYYDASGAPSWAGGTYHHLDGRIRLPIAGLDPRLDHDIEERLMHEVTHAFVAEIAGARCPSDVNEGLAQYMEGKRLRQAFSEARIRDFLEGRVGDPYDRYFRALGFVEYLIGERGMGGINDLLRAIGQTGDVDEAFRQVHGRERERLMQLCFARLRQRYG